MNLEFSFGYPSDRKSTNTEQKFSLSFFFLCFLCTAVTFSQTANIFFLNIACNCVIACSSNFLPLFYPSIMNWGGFTMVKK